MMRYFNLHFVHSFLFIFNIFRVYLLSFFFFHSQTSFNLIYFLI